MFAAIFAFVFVTAYAADEIPSYIHVCGVKDPNYTECFVDNVNRVLGKLCLTGIPEFNVLPIEPVIIEEIVIYDTDKLKLNIKDSKVRGICDFDITSSHIIPETYYKFNFILKHLTMNSTYDFDIRVLVSLANKGIVYVSADDVEGELTIELKTVTKGGKTQIYVAKVTTNIDLKTFNYEFDDSEKDLVQLHEVMRNTISESEKDIIIKVKPKLEEVVSKLSMSVINTILYDRYDQLFLAETP
ncbi:uncharacterized protein [Temnothorax longispinosus]|uniref:Circadian clock-controlled protein n=1 Tax=Temnothorax longispinosus TaxID=300112 RepID=A0A4S2KMQ6_9HYME|nr:Circadian clock-controlled protein [Temnothorax longispinosus]